MTTESQEPVAPLTPADSYNAAVQLHNQEFRTLGERTMGFVIIQSILVAAFVTVLVNPKWFPYIFEFITFGISIIGILFCISHHVAGQSGSQAAFRWRQYMLNIENNQRDAPWNSIYEHCPHTCRGTGIRRFLTQSRCERCLLERPPLPTAWLVSPAIFLLVWFFASLYVVLNYTVIGYIFDQPRQLPLWVFIILSFLVLAILFYAVRTVIQDYLAWWRTPPATRS